MGPSLIDQGSLSSWLVAAVVAVDFAVIAVLALPRPGRYRRLARWLRGRDDEGRLVLSERGVFVERRRR